ncbi:MAG: helix-turn-helix transcriptional regulator [Peptostreptococcaceae bacterium]
MKERFIGKNLKKLRKDKGKTLKEVSQETGLAVSTIEDIENEVSFSNYIDTIVKLSRYFEISVHDFVYKKF